MQHTVGLNCWQHDPTWNPLNEEVVKISLQMILRKENHPVLLCCCTGTHLIGAVVGCLRRIQRWRIHSILEEYHRFARARRSAMCEQFLEFFDIDLIHVGNASVVPSWLAWQWVVDEEEEEEENKQQEKRRNAQRVWDQMGDQFRKSMDDLTSLPPAKGGGITEEPSYMRWYFDPRCPLISRPEFDPKKSIIEEEDD
jgi:hypothetical protein